MNDSISYWDACIVCLPPEKRAAAERAYQEIADGGQDGFFPKVFLLLEAHAAYTNTIPARITEAGEQAAARVREAAGARPENGGASKEDMDRLLAAIGQIKPDESVQAMKPKLEEMALEMKRLNQQVSRLRNLRVGAALFLVCITAVFSGGLVYWRNHERQGADLRALRLAGVELRTRRTETNLLVLIKGPVESTVRVDNAGKPGVGFTVPLR
jgi:hypothetical protein